MAKLPGLHLSTRPPRGPSLDAQSNEARATKFPKNYRTLLPADMARIKKIRHSNKKRPNRNFAMAAAPAAMLVNPNSAATIAIIKKITAQRNIVSPPENGIESSHRYAWLFCATKFDN